MEALLHDKLNYWIFIILMMLGLWAMISKKNLIKKIMGMNVFQAAVILFYVSIGAKQSGSDIPIYPHDLIHPEQHAEETIAHEAVSNTLAAEGATVHQHKAEAEATAHQMHHADAPHQDQEHHADKKTHHVSNMASQEHHAAHPSIAAKINPDDYDNPLPHVLMLTAIVVGVATLGVALSLVQRIYRLFGSIEENEVIAAITKETADEYMVESMQTSQSDIHTGSHA